MLAREEFQGKSHLRFVIPGRQLGFLFHRVTLRWQPFCVWGRYRFPNGIVTPQTRQRLEAMDVLDRIHTQVSRNKVVAYIKGTPARPLCGESARLVEVLRSWVEQCHWVDILNDPEVRAFLPKYRNWPTFPQLFVQAELVGGADVAVELHAKGELAPMMEGLFREPSNLRAAS